MRLWSCAQSAIIAALITILTVTCASVYGQGVYVPGQWYDQDKYNDNGTGRTENYWCVLVQDSHGNFYVNDEWSPAFAWSDMLDSDLNRNYAVDDGETWDKFVWVDTGLLSGYYWCDVDRSGGLSTGDPIFLGSVSDPYALGHFSLDYNQNRVEDPWENWNLWQVHDDKSCWAAAGSNVMQYIDGSGGRYHQSMYEQGVDYIDLAGDDLHYWTDGGWPHKMIDAWHGFDEVNHDTGITQSILWDESPIPGIKGRLKLGIPVALGVQWEGGGAHAFTVYGIDTDAHTLLIADSDSDRGGTQFYEIGYRWIEGAVGNGNLQIDWRGDGSWNADYIIDYTSLGNTTTSPFGGDFGWFEGAFNKFTGEYIVVSVGDYHNSPATTVHLRPYQEGQAEYRDALAGRIIIENNATLEAESGTTLDMKSMAIKQGGRFLLEGSLVDVYHELVCDGTMDVTDGIADIHYLTVGTSTPGQVNQSGGIVTPGVLELGWDTLAQGGLTITQGAFSSNARGTYNLSDGILRSNIELIGSKGTGTFHQSGGINQIDWRFVLGDDEGATGTYNLTGGTLRSAAAFNDSRMIVGHHGDGTLNVSGTGELEVQGNFYAGFWGTSNYNHISLTGDASLLARGDEMIGYMGDADFLQNTNLTGGHTVEGTLKIAVGEFSTAGYLLQNGRLTADSVVVGVEGTADFTHVTGRHEVGNLTLAELAASTATYQIFGGTLETTYNLHVGKAGDASFLQNAASVAVGNHLKLGIEAGATGDYQLLNVGTLAVNADELVGGFGHGVFTQTSGTHSVAGQLSIGKEVGGSGEFMLQDGSLSSFVTELGGYGTGTFTQNGGENNVTIELGLGKHIGGRGTYTLNDGTLSTRSTVAGAYGIGVFVQNGGLHHVSTDLTLGYHQDSAGAYTINDGTLDVRAGTIFLGRNGDAKGRLDLNGGTVWADTIDPIGTLSEFHASDGTLHVNGLDLGRYYDQDLTLDNLYVGHNGGASDGSVRLGKKVSLTVNELVLGYDRDKIATLQMVDQEGSTSTIIANNFFLGQAERSRGTFVLDQPCLVTSEYQYVGYWGEGSITQSRGKNTAEAFYLGFWPGSDGHYNLSGGSIESGDAVIGVGGEGSFHQSGGTNTLTGGLYIGFGTDADGRYTLENGTLSTPKIDISKNGGTGRLVLMDGSAQLDTDELIVRSGGWVNSYRDLFWDAHMQVDGGNVIVDSNRSLVLHDGGRVDLTAGNILTDSFTLGSALDSSPSGTTSYYTQTGGNTQIAHDAYIGSSTGCPGQFALSGEASTVSADRFFVGSASLGRMNHSEGTLTAGQTVAVGLHDRGIGYYLFSGGAVHTPRLEIGGEGAGQFSWTGGTLDADQVFINTNGNMTVDQNWIVSGKLNVAGGTLAMMDDALIVDHEQFATAGLAVSGGTLVADQIKLASNGSPALIHSGGTVSANLISLKTVDWVSPTYEMSGTAVLHTPELNIAGGIFHQDGGASSVTVNTYIDGRFKLDSGSFNCPTVYAGYTFFGEYSQSGGQADIDTLLIAGGTAFQGGGLLNGSGSLNTHTTRVGVNGSGWFEQDGGTHAVTDRLIIGENYGMEVNSEYWLRSGYVTSHDTVVGRNGSGLFRQDGGSHVVSHSLEIASGDLPASGYYSMHGGTLQATTINIGSGQNQGVFALYGGTVEAPTINIDGQGTMAMETNWSKTGGNLNITNGGTFISNSYQMSVVGGDVTVKDGWIYGKKFVLQSTEEATSTLRGHGHIMEEGYGFNTEFVNNGKVIADGYGAPRVLDLSDVKKASNTQDNPGDWGWYAENQGELRFPDATITNDKWLYSWGDDNTNWEPDLVNSVQLYLYDAMISGMDRTFSVSLLSLDHPSIPAGLEGKLLGVWNLLAPSGLVINDATLVFRYDDAMVNSNNWLEDDLRLFRYDGRSWIDLGGYIDGSMHYIYADNVTEFSMYAVGVPEPVTAGFFLIGLAAVFSRRRSRTR